MWRVSTAGASVFHPAREPSRATVPERGDESKTYLLTAEDGLNPRVVGGGRPFGFNAPGLSIKIRFNFGPLRIVCRAGLTPRSRALPI